MGKIALPPGFVYIPEIMSVDEERDLIELARSFTYEPFVMRGQPSLRGTISFGHAYATTSSYRMEPAPPMPPLIAARRDRAAELAGVDPGDLVHALVTHYPPGAAIGWHRDFPVFGPVILGVSLGGACRMRLRPRGQTKGAVAIDLAARSMYVLAGDARTSWEHSIPATRATRWSITFRSLAKKRRAPDRGSGASRTQRGA